MRRSTLLTPVSIIISACLLIGIMLFQPDQGSRAAPLNNIEDYEPPTQTAIANATNTAIAIANGYVEPSAAPVTPPNPPANPQTTTAATSTRTATSTPTRTATTDDFGQVTPTPQQSGGAGSQATAAAESAPTPTLDANTRSCAPGTTVAISGQGPANAGFLVYFDDRVVSGGTVRRDGQFDLSLVIGNEGAGDYPVEVRIRGTRTVLTEFTCQVPATTPTPLASR